jgi:hypothetical protein
MTDSATACAASRAASGGVFTAGLLALLAADALKNYFEAQGKKLTTTAAVRRNQAEADRWREGKFDHPFGDALQPDRGPDQPQHRGDLLPASAGRNLGQEPYSTFLHRPTRYSRAADLFRTAPPLSDPRAGLGGDPFAGLPAPWQQGQSNKLGIFGAPSPKSPYTGPVPFRFVGDIVNDAKTVVDLYKKGKASKQQAQDAIHKALLEMETSRGSGRDQAAGDRLLKNTQALLGPDKKHGLGLRDVLSKLSPKDLIAYVQEQTALIQGLGTDGQSLDTQRPRSRSRPRRVASTRPATRPRRSRPRATA